MALQQQQHAGSASGSASASSSSSGLHLLASPFEDTTHTKFFVGGLAWETTSERLRRLYERFGDILETVVITDRHSGRSKDYGLPNLIAHSERVTFANLKAPVYPRLAQGKSWNEMTVTWTSGYSTKEATPFVEWGVQGQIQILSPAGTLTFGRNTMCGPPARTVGWRDPGFIHTSFLKDLWLNFKYTYRIGHRLSNGPIVWGRQYSFQAPPYPGEDSLQRVVIFRDMGKVQMDVD